MLLAYKRVTLPASSSHGASTSSAAHVSHQGRRAIPTATSDEVNKWAFVAEKVMHGNPSGVDNSVSIHGGALAFARAHGGRKGKMEGMGGFKSVRFLLTDSRVPRDSKRLVEGVAKKLEEVSPRTQDTHEHESCELMGHFPGPRADPGGDGRYPTNRGRRFAIAERPRSTEGEDAPGARVAHAGEPCTPRHAWRFPPVARGDSRGYVLIWAKHQAYWCGRRRVRCYACP